MKIPSDTNLTSDADYRQFIEALKARVANARISAARKVNHELIMLYWDIGRGIVDKQQVLGWGESVVELWPRISRRHFRERPAFPCKMCGGCCNFTAHTPLLNFSHSL